MPTDPTEHPSWYRAPAGHGAPVATATRPLPPLDPTPVAFPRPSPSTQRAEAAAALASPARQLADAAEALEAPPAPPVQELDLVGGKGWHVRRTAREIAMAEARNAAAREAVALATARRQARRRRRLLIAGAAIALVGVAAPIIVPRVMSALNPVHTVARPAAIGSMTLLDAAQTDAARSLVSQGWTHVISGTYGQSGQSQLTLLAGRPPAPTTDDSAFLSGFAGGLKKNGYTFDPAAATQFNNYGTPYSCGAATGANATLSLCVWSDGDVVGLVIDTSGASTAQTYGEAVQARAAVER